MGKQKRERKKYHLEAKSPTKVQPEAANTNHPSTLNPCTNLVLAPPLLEKSEHLFEGLKIDITSLAKNLSDDVQSVKSYKSVKSELGKEKSLSKKEKLLLRREMFLKKLNAATETKKQQQIRKKRKHTAIMGDTNPLHDALPSLEYLLKKRGNVPYKSAPKKDRGIEKASKQKKDYLQGIKVYKQISKNKNFQKNPLQLINQHLKVVVEQERSQCKK